MFLLLIFNRAVTTVYLLSLDAVAFGMGNGKGSFLRLALSRKTTYEFQEDKTIPPQTVKNVLEAGRWAPSCMNSQPWSFIVVDKKSRVADLVGASFFGGFHSLPSLLICLVLDGNCWNDDEHPTVKDGLLGRYEALLSMGFPAANMIFAAQDEGLSTCILTPEREKAARLLDLKKGDLLALAIGLGYERRGAFQKPRTRRRLSDIVIKDRGKGYDPHCPPQATDPFSSVEKAGGSVNLYLTSPEKHTSTKTRLLESLTGRLNKKGLIVSLNETSNNVMTQLKESRAKGENLYILDGVTQDPKKIAKNATLLSSPPSLTELSLAISTALNTGTFNFLMLDSVETLSRHHPAATVRRFTEYLISKLKSFGVDGVLLLVERQNAEELARALRPSCNRFIRSE